MPVSGVFVSRTSQQKNCNIKKPLMSHICNVMASTTAVGVLVLTLMHFLHAYFLKCILLLPSTKVPSATFKSLARDTEWWGFILTGWRRFHVWKKLPPMVLACLEPHFLTDWSIYAWTIPFFILQMGGSEQKYFKRTEGGIFVFFKYPITNNHFLPFLSWEYQLSWVL